VNRCKAYLNRLSGPLVDRFGLIFFNELNKISRSVTGIEIDERLRRYRTTSTVKQYDTLLFERLYGHLSRRRQHALLKVAEVYATESKHQQIELIDLTKSEKWTVQGFLQLEKGMC
jgi:hypothetical protein